MPVFVRVEKKTAARPWMKITPITNGLLITHRIVRDKRNVYMIRI